MSDSDLIDARWVGPYSATWDNQELVTGETVMRIPRDEAIASRNWEPVGGPTVGELRAEAEKLGIDTKGLRKPDLVKAIADAREAAAGGDS